MTNSQQIGWKVLFTERFYTWYLHQDEKTQNSVLAAIQRLKLAGPHLARPYADTVKDS